MQPDKQIATCAPADGQGPAIQPRRRSPLRAILFPLLLAVVLVFVGRSLLDGIASIDWANQRFNVVLLLAGAAVLATHELLCGLTLKLSIMSFGQRIPLRWSVASYWSASLGKYVPGKIATLAGIIALLSRFGLRATVAMGSAFLHTGLNVLVGMVIALPPLLVALSQAGSRQAPLWVWIAGGLAVAGAAVCLHPRVFLRLANFALRRTGRAGIAPAGGPQNRYILAAAAMTAVRLCVLGCGAWLVVRSIAPISAGQLPMTVAVAVGASIAGLLAVFAPAGLGVREWVYMLLLAGPIGAPAAALAALLIRVVQTLVDIALGLTGAGMFARQSPFGVRRP